MERVMHDVGLVIAAGGASTRLGDGRNKLLLDWHGTALFCHCLLRFLPRLRPDHTVVIAPAARLAEFQDAMQRHGIPEAVRVLAGGDSRQESVWIGLQAMPAAAAIIAVHDGARPCAEAGLLAACVTAARESGSGVAARRLTDTVKQADATGQVTRTLDRSQLWAAETPQVFRRDWLQESYERLRRTGGTVTDDAQALELAGHPVRLVENRAPNPKITFAEDLETPLRKG